MLLGSGTYNADYFDDIFDGEIITGNGLGKNGTTIVVKDRNLTWNNLGGGIRDCHIVLQGKASIVVTRDKHNNSAVDWSIRDTLIDGEGTGVAPLYIRGSELTRGDNVQINAYGTYEAALAFESISDPYIRPSDGYPIFGTCSGHNWQSLDLRKQNAKSAHILIRGNVTSLFVRNNIWLSGEEDGESIVYESIPDVIIKDNNDNKYVLPGVSYYSRISARWERTAESVVIKGGRDPINSIVRWDFGGEIVHPRKGE